MLTWNILLSASDFSIGIRIGVEARPYASKKYRYRPHIDAKRIIELKMTPHRFHNTTKKEIS